MNKKISIVVLLLLLTVGFAAVTTNLLLNGQARISINPDFDVYFSSVESYNNEDTIEISSDKHSLTFNTRKLSEANNDSSKFYYEITNNSMEFDASITFTINITSSVDYSDYITTVLLYCDEENEQNVEITNGTVINIPAGRTIYGFINVDLNKNVTADIQISFSVSMNATAVEGAGYVEPVATICDLTEEYCADRDPGTEVKIGDEHFYYLGSTSQNNTLYHTFLAKYNLGVGDGFETPTNKQEPTADGVNLGTIAFQNKKMETVLDDDSNPIEIESSNQSGYWVDNSNQLKSEYGTSYPAFVYDSNCIFKQYVDNYVATLGRTVYDEEEIVGSLLTKELFDEVYEYLTPSKKIEIFNSDFWLGSATSYLQMGLSPKNEDGRNLVASKSAVAKSGVRPVILIGISK